MNDTAMALLSVPVMGIYSVLTWRLHLQWLGSGQEWEVERRAEAQAERVRKWQETEELLKWAESLPAEPEPVRTYERKQEPESEAGMTTEWEEVKYS